MESCFKELEETLTTDTPSTNIVNYDETNFTDDPGAVKFVVNHGVKHAYRTLDTTKSSTRIMSVYQQMVHW